MPKKPMPLEQPGKGDPSPPPPRPPDSPGEPPGPGPSEYQRNPSPSEGGFTVSALVAKLITDIQTGIQAAFLHQVESASRELEVLRTLPEERLAEYLVPQDEVISEFQRLFPSLERAGEISMRRIAGIPYKPAAPEKGQEEDPPIKRLTGYEIKSEDIEEGRISPEGERRIIDHLRKKIAQERLEAVKEVYRRGLPYILVDHGKISVKLVFYAQQQQPSQTQQRSAEQSTKVFTAFREAIPLRIEAGVVNERNIEALGREAGAIGEIEISFKVDLR